MIIDHKYGKIKVNPKTYHKDMPVASYHAIDDYNFILNKIKDIAPEFLKEKEIISREKPKDDKWVFKDKYGIFRMHITDILNNSKPASYLNRTEAFVNKINEKWPEFFNTYTLLGEIRRAHSEMVITDSFGVYSTNVNRVLSLGGVSARSCLNKTQRYLNMFKKHKDFDNYDFSLYKYTNKNTKGKFICEEHGVFSMLTHDFLNNKNCSKCNPEYYSKEVANSNKKLFKNKYAVLYLVKIYNKEESFYKIGITVNLEKRFKEIQKNYEYHPIKLIHTNLYDAIQIEDKILNSKTKKYSPKIKFGGHTECFLEKPNLIQ